MRERWTWTWIAAVGIDCADGCYLQQGMTSRYCVEGGRLAVGRWRNLARGSLVAWSGAFC